MKYEITDEQLKQISADGCTYVQQWFPNAFKKELKVGTWYKSLEPNGSLFEYIGHKTARGFFQGVEWTDQWYWPTTNQLREATESEVFEALKNEAIKRGFAGGIYVDRPLSFLNQGVVEIDFNNKGYSLFGSENSKMQLNGYSIYEEGVWAEIIPSITKSEAEKQLGKKIIG